MTRVGVVGAGLIGGSICKSLRQAGLHSITVYSQSDSTQEEVRADGFSVVESLNDLVQSSDVVFVCVPLEAQMNVFRDVATAIASTARKGIVVTDVSSVKGPQAREAVELFTQVGATFVPGHPMAGTEFSGFRAATDKMFHAATWVLCPESASHHVVADVAELVLSMNARVSLLDINTHDAAVGSISHLPYVVAASLANVLPSSGTQELALQLAAGSFRDGTRVAGSEPWLSASMVNFNRTEVLRLISLFQSELTKMTEALAAGKDKDVLEIFQNAHGVRRDYDKVKSDVTRKEVVWNVTDAIQQALTECRSGALISNISVQGNQWTVTLDGVNQ